MPAFLMVALATRSLQDGSAEAIIGAILNEASARQKLAANVLVQHAYSRHPNGHHIWVPLPRNWGQTEFASHVQRQGLAIVTAESFSVGESQPNAIRVSLGAASSRAELVRALEILAAALKPPAARARVVWLGGRAISMVFESSLKPTFLIVSKGCSTASRRVRMASGLASSRSFRKKPRARTMGLLNGSRIQTIFVSACTSRPSRRVKDCGVQSVTWRRR
jgi:hypothetical protein